MSGEARAGKQGPLAVKSEMGEWREVSWGFLRSHPRVNTPCGHLTTDLRRLWGIRKDWRCDECGGTFAAPGYKCMTCGHFYLRAGGTKAHERSDAHVAFVKWNDEFERRRGERETRIAALDKDLLQRQQDLAAVNAAAEGARQRAERLVEEELGPVRDRVRSEVARIRASAESLTRERDSLAESVETLRKKVADERVQLEAVGAEARGAKSAVAKAKHELEALRLQTEKAQDEAANAQEDGLIWKRKDRALWDGSPDEVYAILATAECYGNERDIEVHEDQTIAVLIVRGMADGDIARARHVSVARIQKVYRDPALLKAYRERMGPPPDGYVWAAPKETNRSGDGADPADLEAKRLHDSELDAEIRRRLERGETYKAVQAATGATPRRIAKVAKTLRGEAS